MSIPLIVVIVFFGCPANIFFKDAMYKKRSVLLFFLFALPEMEAMKKIELSPDELLVFCPKTMSFITAPIDEVLHDRCRKGLEKAVKQLLDGGANVNSRSEKGESVLHHAAYNKSTTLARLLIEQNSELVHAQDYLKQTPLHVAAKWGRINSLTLLIEHGADVNAKNKYGELPIHLVSDAKTAQVLMDHGANINAKRDDGQTLLHWICQGPYIDIDLARLIVEKAETNVTDNQGRTPLYHAAQACCNINIIKLLLKGPLGIRHLILSRKIESLENACLQKVLNLLDNREYDDETIFAIVIPQLIKYKYEKFINLNLHEEYLLHHASTLEAKSLIKQNIDNYRHWYLEYIKNKITADDINENNLLDLARSSERIPIVNLFESILAANSFNELPKDMQDIFYLEPIK